MACPSLGYLLLAFCQFLFSAQPTLRGSHCGHWMGPCRTHSPLPFTSHLPSVSTQYLLSMVVEYFGRVGLPGHLYNRIHFFLAL